MTAVRNMRILWTIPLLIVVFLASIPVYAKYSGGTGEPNDPYKIATAEDLIAMGNEPNDYDKHFILTEDIDLAGYVFDKAVIAPETGIVDRECYIIGVPFYGVFNGRGHNISHLTIKGKDFLGLFGRLGSGADVSDLGVIDVNIIGSSNYIGGLCGEILGCTITHCHSTGEVSGNINVGGLVGVNFGTLTECFSDVDVSGSREIGGLVGLNMLEGIINQSYDTGAIVGTSYVGGLAGDNIGIITDSYATGGVEGSRSVGGLVGVNGLFTDLGGVMGIISNCYSAGDIRGTIDVGGLVGFSYVTITNCFWNIKTSGQSTSSGGIGKTTAEMQTASTFLEAGWDFVGETANGTEDIWWIDEGKDYPKLWWEPDEADSNEPYANPDIRDRSLVVQDISQSDIYQGVDIECKEGWCMAHRNQNQLEESISDTLGDPDIPLYFIFAVHTCDNICIDEPSRFDSGVANIRKIQNLLAEYGGKLSFQVSLRWAELTQDSNDQTLRWLANQGSEIALHIHDEYLIPRYLGQEYQGVQAGLDLAQQQPLNVWIGAFELIKDKVETVSAVSPIRLFNGAPMCSERFYVGAKVGLEVTADYKNPETRTTDEKLAVLNPWRPAGSSDVTEIAAYDRNGPIIFVPSGVYPAHCPDSGGVPTPFTYASMDYITMLLRNNLSCVSPGRINVFSVMFHPWDFEESDFALWKTWLDSIMQPLLDSSRVKWGIFGEVAEMYKTYELTAVPK